MFWMKKEAFEDTTIKAPTKNTLCLHKSNQKAVFLALKTQGKRASWSILDSYFQFIRLNIRFRVSLKLKY
jgi:hypothetical protein